MPTGRGTVVVAAETTRVLIVVPNPVVRAGGRTLVEEQGRDLDDENAKHIRGTC